jgi:periplasmic divalent cation tolerance protein
MSDTRVVLVTVGDKETGLVLVRKVVEEKIAACGNLLPGVTSVFEWDGSIQEEREVLLILKTSADLVSRLVDRVAELHTYDVPEVLVLGVEGGYEPYLKWVHEQTNQESYHDQK